MQCYEYTEIWRGKIARLYAQDIWDFMWVSEGVLGCQVVDLDALRELAWSGVPVEMRPVCWQLLLGYLPPNRERRYFTCAVLHMKEVGWIPFLTIC